MAETVLAVTTTPVENGFTVEVTTLESSGNRTRRTTYIAENLGDVVVIIVDVLGQTPADAQFKAKVEQLRLA